MTCLFPWTREKHAECHATRRSVRKHFLGSALVECHDFSWSAMSPTFVSHSVAQLFTAHAFAWLKSHPCSFLTACHIRSCASFSSPCHPCQLDRYATLTGLDCARDRLSKSPCNMVAELTLGGTASIMSVTAEQWAQAEAERQRQADVVQTLINEVRRLGTEKNKYLQERQRLRAEHLLSTPPMEERASQATGQPPPRTPPAGRAITDTRGGKPPVFTSDKNPWRGWSSKLHSYVATVDLRYKNTVAEVDMKKRLSSL